MRYLFVLFTSVHVLLFAESFRNHQQPVYVPCNRPTTSMFGSQYTNSTHSPNWHPPPHPLQASAHQSTPNSLPSSFYTTQNTMLWPNPTFQTATSYGKFLYKIGVT